MHLANNVDFDFMSRVSVEYFSQRLPLIYVETLARSQIDFVRRPATVICNYTGRVQGSSQWSGNKQRRE